MVIIAVLSFKRLRNNVTNYFIISLATADLMVCTFVMPYNAVNEILGYWPFGLVFCDVYISLDILCCTASILNLCVISLDRYLAITSPFTYYERITKKTAGVLIAVVWIVSFLISALPVNLDFHEDPEFADIGWYTDPELCVLVMNSTYALVSSIVSFYTPTVIIIFVYSRIFVVARRQARQIAAYENTAKRFTGTSKKSMARERKAAKTLAIIVGVFIACWLPFFIANIVDPFCGRCVDVKLMTVLVWLGFVNSFLNPIIYAQNKTFRRAFKNLLCCHRCKGIQLRDTDTSDAENTAMTNAPVGQYRTKSDMHNVAVSRPTSRAPSTAAVSTISAHVGSTTNNGGNKVEQTAYKPVNKSDHITPEPQVDNEPVQNRYEELEPVKTVEPTANEEPVELAPNESSTIPKSETVETVSPDSNSQESQDNSNQDSSTNNNNGFNNVEEIQA